jgi:cytochrome P450
MSLWSESFRGLGSLSVSSCASLLAFTIFIAIACSLHRYVTKSWILRKFRGPYALPVVGNCYNPNSFSLFRYLAEQRRKYGKTFLLFLFQKTYLVTTEPAVLKRFFSDTKSFAKCDNYQQLSSLVLGDSLATSTHEYHRHLFSHYFSIPSIAAHMSLFRQVTQETITELIPANPCKDSSFDIHLFFSRLALRSILQYSMGYSYKEKGLREIEVYCSFEFSF